MNESEIRAMGGFFNDVSNGLEKEVSTVFIRLSSLLIPDLLVYSVRGHFKKEAFQLDNTRELHFHF